MVDFSPVPGVDEQARDAVLTALAATPRGVSYGRLTEPAAWLASCQGNVPATPLHRPRIVVFAGEHAIAYRKYDQAGISAFAPEATAQQVAELSDHAGPIHTLAQRAEVGISLVRCAPAAGAIDVEDAMSQSVCDNALSMGISAADREVDAGADLLIPAELGVGTTAVAAVVMGVLTGTEPVAVVGPGSGTTDAMWKTKVQVVRDAMFRARGLVSHPLELIRVATGPDFAAIVGFIAQAAARRTPILVDSPLVTAAAVLAERVAPVTAAWLSAAAITPEPAHRLALEDLGLAPLLDLGMHAGSGFGALTAMPLIQSGIELAGDEVRAVSTALN